MVQLTVTTNIAQIEAERKLVLRRFIMVKQFPGNAADDPGGFFYEADGVCFEDGTIIVRQAGMLHNSYRIEFYRDEDHCTLMNPDWDLRWLDS